MVTITIDFSMAFFPTRRPGDDQHETEGEGGVSGEHQGVDLGRFLRRSLEKAEVMILTRPGYVKQFANLKPWPSRNSGFTH
jgi:hypothetical protein